MRPQKRRRRARYTRCAVLTQPPSKEELRWFGSIVKCALNGEPSSEKTCGLKQGSAVGNSTGAHLINPELSKETDAASKHFKLASKIAAHPAEWQTNLANSTIEVYQKLASFKSANDINDFRRNKCDEITKLARAPEINARSKELAARARPEIRHIVGSKNLGLWEHLCKLAQHEESEIAALFAEGLPMKGDLKETGVWKTKLQEGRPITHPQPEHELREQIPEGINAAVSQMRSQWNSTPAEWKEFGFNEVERMIRMKRYTIEKDAFVKFKDDGSPMIVDAQGRERNDVLPAAMFIVDSGHKLRPVFNYKSNKANKAVFVPDIVKQPSVELVAQMHKACHRIAGEITGIPGCVRVDMDIAFLQIPNAKGDPEWFALLVYDPQKMTHKAAAEMKNPPPMRILRTLVNAFGGAASSFNFNRVAASFRTILQKIFLIPVENCCDDFIVVDGQLVADSALECVITLFKLLGFEANEAKTVPWGSHGPKDTVLGQMFRCVRLKDGRLALRISLSAAKRAKYSAAIRAVLRKKRISSSEASSLLGQLMHAGEAIQGRIGRGLLVELSKIAKTSKKSSESISITHGLSETFKTWLVLLQYAERIIVLDEDESLPVIAYSDAAIGSKWSEKIQLPKEQVGRAPRASLWVSFGFVLSHPEFGAIARGAEMPLAEFEKILGLDADPQEKAWIHHAEAYAALLAFALAPEGWLDEQTVLWFGDNEVATRSITKGFSTSRCLAKISAAVWGLLATKRTRPFIEGTRTELQLGDGPSRDYWDEVKKLGCACSYINRSEFIPLSDFDLSGRAKTPPQYSLI